MNHPKIQLAKSVALHPYANKVALAGVVFCLFAYIYFANSAVRNVTLLEDAKGDLEALQASVSELESKNLALVNQISMERAKSVGLHEAQNPVFLVKGDRESTLSFNR